MKIYIFFFFLLICSVVTSFVITSSAYAQSSGCSGPSSAGQSCTWTRKIYGRGETVIGTESGSGKCSATGLNCIPIDATDQVDEDRFFGWTSVRSLEIFDYGRAFLLPVAGLGILGLAALSFFGRMRWVWFFTLSGGIILIAAADMIVGWMMME